MSKQLTAFIGDNPELRPLLEHARELQRWQGEFEQIVPPSLRPSCRVGQVDAGRLQLLADNGTVAAKLRQLAPTLLEALQSKGCPIREVWVRVQVGGYAAPRRKGGGALGSQGQQEVRLLAESLAESPLRSALEKLLQHCR
jgi:hypothetical protein